MLTPCGSKIPERILINLRIYNYVNGTTIHANACCTVRQRGSSGRTRELSNLFGIHLSIPLLPTLA